jgi:hypothetical protein
LGKDCAASVLLQSFETICDARTEQDTDEEREEYSLIPYLSKQGAHENMTYLMPEL